MMMGIGLEMALCYGSDEDKKKYRHPEFDDEIEGLAKYFRIDGYPSLCSFLRKLQHD
jgi:hypothetical protein